MGNFGNFIMFYHEIQKLIPTPPDLKDIETKHWIEQVSAFLFGHNRSLVSIQNM